MTLTAFHDPGFFIFARVRCLRGLFELPRPCHFEKRLEEFPFSIDYVPIRKRWARSAPVGEMALMAAGSDCGTDG